MSETVFFMKTNIILLIAVILFAAQSCNSDKAEEASDDPGTSDLSAGEKVFPLSKEEFPQEWQLVTMSGMLANSETSGEDMMYQETYRFSPDNTFTKIRQNNDEEVEASGTFEHVSTGTGEEYYKLSYTEENELIENCDGGKGEWLLLDQEKTLRGTANACDHMTKAYEKI